MRNTAAPTNRVTRRTALKAFGTSAGAIAALPWLSDEGLLAFAQLQQASAAPNPTVFSASQFAALEVLVEAIVPTDDRSPGAKEARVADYIDLLLSESDRAAALEWFGDKFSVSGRQRFQVAIDLAGQFQSTPANMHGKPL